jgi:hypothetical protein
MTGEKGLHTVKVGCCGFPGGWGETLSEWLKTAITLERLEMNMRILKGEEPTGTNAEACAYLMAVSLTQPMDSDWTQIYLFIASKTYTRWGKQEMPADIRVNSLNDYQAGELKRFKGWLYQKRTQGKVDEGASRETGRKRGRDRQEKGATTETSHIEQGACVVNSPILLRYFVLALGYKSAYVSD